MIEKLEVQIPEDVLYLVLGSRDENIKEFEKIFHIQIIPRGNSLLAQGEQGNIDKFENFLQNLAKKLDENKIKSSLDVLSLAINTVKKEDEEDEFVEEKVILITHRKKTIVAKTKSQVDYVNTIENNTITFGIGPAGTGKTYLAVAMAVSYLKQNRVNKIILTRPAVEAGEKLGFLPGTIEEKVDPYLRPLYDALYEMVDADKIKDMLEKNIIEIAPIAFMRGRTLNDAFIILDEAQNTTREQMKMFLTRIGFGSKAVITGDITQVDLPKVSQSGLIEAIKVLKDIEDIGFTYFSEKDVVRHPVVQRIIKAYERYEESQNH
ncbi:MAG: PhoH family protein [Persephonella sp.]|nr:MAG: PhoH family protein [Persephonella sp.]RUM60124.1 MAG: PhoH family protein [Persephonella sp.]